MRLRSCSCYYCLCCKANNNESVIQTTNNVFVNMDHNNTEFFYFIVYNIRTTIACNEINEF